MIYHYIAELTLSGLALIAMLAYLEEKKAHEKTFHQAKNIIHEHQEIMEAMEAENTRLAIVAKAYRIAAITQPKK